MDQEQKTPQIGASNNSTQFAVGAVAVVAVLLLVGYIMNTKQDSPEIAQAPVQNSLPQGDSATMALASQSSSDDLSSINADLRATNMNSLNDSDKI